MISIRNATLALAALVVGIGLGAVPEEVHAKRVCKATDPTPSEGCVKKKDIKSGAATGSKMADGAVTSSKIADGAVTSSKISSNSISGSDISDNSISESKLDQALKDKINDSSSGTPSSSTESVYETTNVSDGDNTTQGKTLATHGTLRYFYTCSLNEGGTNDRLRIYVTSTASEWYTNQQATTKQVAGNEVLISTESVTTNNPRYDEDTSDSSAIDSQGNHLGFAGDMLGVGLNLFPNTGLQRCTVVGTFFKVTRGTP